MSEEENKITEEIVEDDDFADAPKPVPETPVEEVKEEEAVPAEQEPEFPEEEPEADEPEPIEEPEPTPEFDAKGKRVYHYDDERLAEVEASRKTFAQSYKKSNLIKTIVSLICLVCMATSFVLCYFVLQLETVGLYISLGVCVAGVAGMAVTSAVLKKSHQKNLRNYFNTYFTNTNDYVLEGLPITKLNGDVDQKISQAEFCESGIFPSVHAVGSRDNITFIYDDDMECAMVEAAAQKDAGRNLKTIFVGKYLRTANSVDCSEEGLLIYFNGNDRAMPPESLLNLHLLEKTKRYCVYGSAADRKALTPEFRKYMKEIRTDKLLIDVAIAIKPGKTYFAIGYEDDLMILPMNDAFNPVFVTKEKGHMKMFLEMAHTLQK